MKEICLVRHAKSSWKYPALDDFERPLNKRGRKNAALMGQVIRRLRFSADLMITSPASRAAMTARTLAFEINYPLESIQYLATVYESNETDLLHFIRELDDNLQTVMLIGHNPTITGLANSLGNFPISNIPTCGICCLALSINSWSEIKKKTGQLKYFEYPKKHA